MVVYDFDGVIIESSRTEKLWRRLTEKINIKTPKILFFLQEIIEFTTGKKLKPREETIEIIKRTNQKKRCFLGILTDRSLWSLARSFEKIGLNFNNFNFIQTRRSILDCLIKKPLPLPAASFKSEKTKPDVSIFEKLEKFAEENKISVLDDILIIEDSKQMIEFARAHNFCAIDVEQISCVRYYI